MQFKLLNFRQKYGVLPTLALIFSVKIPGSVAFFDLILLKLHVRPSLNQFWCLFCKFINNKISCFFAILIKTC